MTAPRVNLRERDLSIYTTSPSSIYAAMVLPAVKGKRDVAIPINSRRQLLRMTTPNDTVEVGMHMSYYSALNILQSTDKLVIVIPKANNCKFAGIKFKKDADPIPVAAGMDNPEAEDLTSESASFMISASSQGAWGNDLYVSVVGYKDSEQISAPAITSESEFILTTTQDWGKGFPVQLYGENLPAELNPNHTYFAIRVSANSIKLAATLNDAVASVPVPIKVNKMDAQKVTLSPAIYYTKEPDTMSIRVFKKNDLVNPVKTYVVAKSQSKKNEDGHTLYIEDVITDEEFITVQDNVLITDTYVGDFLVPVRLQGGHDGDPITTGQMIKALRALTNTNEFPTLICCDGGYTQPEFQRALVDMVQKRGDSFACLSTPLTKQQNADTSAQEATNFFKFESNLNTSWGAAYAPHAQIYDEFNDRRVWIAPDSFAVRAILDTASNFEIWYPPAGNRRGVVAALDTKVHYVDADQDLLYDNNVNPIVFEAGQGIKIWGQKTLYRSNSMLDRVNVRLLLITIGPAIKKMLKEFLFEFNDEATRALVRSNITAYMDRIVARRGVTRYQVICDESNNTAQEIDEHKLVVDLLVCPNSSVEYIPFTIGITNNTISFDLARQAL